MNIFYLDSDPASCASMHCDKHVVKMMIEYAQQMSTAHRVLDDDYVLDSSIYRVSHKNHPASKWVRSSNRHYEWLYELWGALSDEYTKRYGKVHASWSKLRYLLKSIPYNISYEHAWSDPPKCMPADCMQDSVVDSYREYYIKEKSYFAKWKYSQIPIWFSAA